MYKLITRVVGDEEEGEQEEEEPKEEEEEDDESKPTMDDILMESRLFQDVGLGLPDEEVYKIAVAMKKLSESKPLSSLRFFGKIICPFGKDYYICETELKEDAKKTGLLV